MSLIKISESDNWIVDYDRERGQYRVSYFEECHFIDEYWFNEYQPDIGWLIGRWFSALEDEGVDLWTDEDCVKIAIQYRYTKEDYKRYLSTIA